MIDRIEAHDFCGKVSEYFWIKDEIGNLFEKAGLKDVKFIIESNNFGRGLQMCILCEGVNCPTCFEKTRFRLQVNLRQELDGYVFDFNKLEKAEQMFRINTSAIRTLNGIGRTDLIAKLIGFKNA